VHIADIGLTGTKAIWNGNKVDAFDLMLGGCLGEEKSWAKTIVPKIPADLVKVVVTQLTRNYLANRVEYEDGEAEPFRAFVARNEADQLAAWSAIEGWTPPVKRVYTPAAVPAGEPADM
jgi:sulfite reductase beta subunit-like hemoprotein